MEEKMTKLFVYGMLQDPSLLKDIIKRVPKMEIAHLKDFSLYNVFGEHYDGKGLIVKAVKTKGLYINGRIIEVTDKELIVFDNFEGGGYKRKPVILYGNIKCEMYY